MLVVATDKYFAQVYMSRRVEIVESLILLNLL
jgi:hypothetical protein